MTIALTDDHRALADVARTMVASRSGTAGARRVLLDAPGEARWWENDPLWKEIVATGWLGLHVDERFGGQGYGLPELTIVLEQLGYCAMGGPFLPTVAVSLVVVAGCETMADLRHQLPTVLFSTPKSPASMRNAGDTAASARGSANARCSLMRRRMASAISSCHEVLRAD